MKMVIYNLKVFLKIVCCRGKVMNFGIMVILNIVDDLKKDNIMEKVFYIIDKEVFCVEDILLMVY